MSPFKASNGNFYIRQLFYEESTGDIGTVLYTLKDYDIEVDGKPIPSLSKLYVAMGDVSEYEFANKYFCNWKHWKMISDSNWFKEYITAWREELAVKKMAETLKKLQLTADGDTRDSFQAQKYLMDKGLLIPKGSKGRPSKDSVKREAEILLKEKENFSDDFDRMIINIDDYKKASVQ